MASSATEKPADVVSMRDQLRMPLFASKDTRLSACDLAVLAEITDRIIKSTGVSRPTSITHLEKETGRHSRSVRNSVNWLIELKYITVVSEGRGTRGTEFALNLPWLHHVGGLVDVELKRQRAAKEAKKPKASLRRQNQTSTGELARADTRTLIPEGWAPSRSLRELVCAPDSTQSYKVPAKAGDFVDKSSGAAGAGLAAAPGADDLVGEITKAWLSPGDDGETLAMLELNGDPDQTVSIVIEAADQREQEIGQRELISLAGAVGVDRFESDLDECVGKAIAVTHYRPNFGEWARTFKAHTIPMISTTTREHHAHDQFQQPATT